MSCRFRTSVLLILACLTVAPHPVSGAKLEDRDWIEVRTPNFRIRSVQNEEDTIELARFLEMFRMAAYSMTNIVTTEFSVPTEIYVLRKRSEFGALGLPGSAVGLFGETLRRNFIFIREARRMSENTVIMHEYVHLLTRTHGAHRYPKWFVEGFAEYLSATRIHDDEFEIGRVAEHRRSNLRQLKWVHLRKILAPDRYDRWSDRDKAMFYAESWALVHYLVNRPDRESSFSSDMANYHQLVESGKKNLKAFEIAFNITAADFDKEVRHYLREGKFPIFKFKIDEILPEFRPQVSTLSRPQVSLALGQIALETDEFKNAERWFSIAATNSLTRPRAESGHGILLMKRGEVEAALPHFEQAISLAPNDAYCQLDLANYWYARATNSNDNNPRPEYLQRARDHYVKAWKLDETLPEIYAMYGKTFVTEGKQFDKAIEMLEQAEYLIPSNIEVRTMLAQAYMGARRKEDAIARALSVLAWSHGESDSAEIARGILARLAPEADLAQR